LQKLDEILARAKNVNEGIKEFQRFEEGGEKPRPDGKTEPLMTETAGTTLHTKKTNLFSCLP
jgi:hypothetical protein